MLKNNSKGLEKSSYAVYAEFYDKTNTDSEFSAEIINKIIEKNHPNSKRLLEIACGTGSVLKHLSDKYEVSGLDISKEMINIAKVKLPKIEVSVQDMTSFKIDRTFDVIYCIYDSINHLLDFKQWVSTFNSVYRHLDKGGIFIFDMHSIEKLEQMLNQPTFVKTFDENYLLVKLDTKNEVIYNWNLKFFSKPIQMNIYSMKKILLKLHFQ